MCSHGRAAVPGLKLIGVRVTLRLGPSESAGARSTAGGGTGGAGGGSADRSTAGGGSADADGVGDSVVDGAELVRRCAGGGRGAALGLGVAVRVLSCGLVGISPPNRPPTSSAVAITRTAAAAPISTSSNRGLRYQGGDTFCGAGGTR